MQTIYQIVTTVVVLATFCQLMHGKVNNQKGRSDSANSKEWLIRNRQEVSYVQDPANLETLKLVQLVFRHGGRTPINSYPNDPYTNYDYGVKGAGQLLSKGIKQGYELGKYLRKRYGEYFSKHYSIEQVYVQASDVDRTIMTAEMCLAGLFENFEKSGSHGNKHKSGLPSFLRLNPIPLRTIPEAMDNKIGETAECRHFDKLYKEILTSPKVESIFKNTEQTVKYLIQKTGLKQIGFDQLVEITDTLNVESITGLKLPDWTKKVYPEKLRETFDLFFRVNTTTTEMSRLFVGTLLAEFVQNMELRISGAPSNSWTVEDLKFYHNRPARGYLFGGHDTTISSILNAFGLYDHEQPVYTSMLALELHSLNNGTREEDFTIKFFYKKQRGKPILELKFPECPSPCTLTDFKKSYSKIIIGNGRWLHECEQ